MTKKQAMEFISKKGIIAAAVHHPDMPKEWVLEWLENFDGSTLEKMPLEEFKKYSREFIEENFK